MSEYTERRKAAQLGMSGAGAQARLRKLLLFRLLQQTGADLCFKCGQPITRADELTIEHIKPWLDVSVDLYWDLDNVSFSHSACNRPHRNGAQQLRRAGPPGTIWCCRCQLFKPESAFGLNRRHWTGRHFYCRACRNATK